MKLKMKRFLSTILCLSMLLGMTSNITYAMDTADNTTEDVIGMDEEGNIWTVEDDTSGVVVENIRSRSASTKIVNFRANAEGIDVTTTTTYNEYDTGNIGYLYGKSGADAAYLGMEDGKVKFMISGVIGLVDASAVQVVNMSSVASYSNYYANGTNLIHNVCTNMTSSQYGATINVGPQPSYLQTGVTYYSYDGHYFYTDYGQMISDYAANTRANSVNEGSPYYNYYQYLPLRSTTVYSANELVNMINAKTSTSSKLYNTGSTFVSYQNTYGVNALLMASAAAVESGWGTSGIAQSKNNLFGLNAVDSSPGESANYYSSVTQCIKDFAETYMSKRYLRAGYTYYNGGFLGNKASGINVRYASDPYWGEKIAAVAWGLDTTNGGGDQCRYTIGIKDTYAYDHTNLNVRQEATTASTVLYQTGNCSHYAFIIWGESNNFYQVQSDPILVNGRSAVDTSTGVYDLSGMYAYASKSYITVVSEGYAQSGITYRSHVQDYGWKGNLYNGQTSGTVGEAKRLEALKIDLNHLEYNGSVTYRTHVQDRGWLGWVSDGEMSGTVGEALRMEAIQIQLTGEVEQYYDIYYRAHVQDFGWLDWAKNGEIAGTTGYGKRLEAIQIVLVEKDGEAPGTTGRPCVLSQIAYSSHVENIGWDSYVPEGATSGTIGQGLRLESIKVQLNSAQYAGSIVYKTHVQDYGWMDWTKDGMASGTEGQAKRLEAIQIQLTGEMAEYYDIYYRVHLQNYGWLDWAKNGEKAGSEGLALRMEAVEIILVEKGGGTPGKTGAAFLMK